jgi:hypothetical protein
VLRQLGTVADQPEAAEARPPRRHRVIGAVGLVLAVAVVGAVIVVATQRTEGPTDKSTPENRHSVSGSDGQCRGGLVWTLRAAAATPGDVIECIRLRTGPLDAGRREALRHNIRLFLRSSSRRAISRPAYQCGRLDQLGEKVACRRASLLRESAMRDTVRVRPPLSLRG